MRVITVPYHLDERLPGLDFPLGGGQTVTAALPPGEVWDRLATLYGEVAAAVAGVAGRGALPVVMSGDCTTALGTMAGLQHAGAGAGIVWFDAHGDVQTLETTASGYLGGLPLRLLAGYRPELIATRLGLRPVPERRIVLVGARVLVVLGVYVVVNYLLTRTEWGRHVYAVGDDAEAARLAGIRTNRVLFSVYVFAGLIIGIAAWVSIGYTGAASPNNAVDANLQSITAVVIGGTSLFGGRGGVIGTLFGALIVVVFTSGLTLANVNDLYQPIARLGQCAGVVTPATTTMADAVAIMTGAKRLEPRAP